MPSISNSCLHKQRSLHRVENEIHRAHYLLVWAHDEQEFYRLQAAIDVTITKVVHKCVLMNIYNSREVFHIGWSMAS